MAMTFLVFPGSKKSEKARKVIKRFIMRQFLSPGNKSSINPGQMQCWQKGQGRINNLNTSLDLVKLTYSKCEYADYEKPDCFTGRNVVVAGSFPHFLQAAC
jgi:hypothetical protein